MNYKNVYKDSSIVDDMIDEKVKEMIDFAAKENKKLRRERSLSLEEEADTAEEAFDFVNTTAELLNIPSYCGEGEPDFVPEIKGTMLDGKISLDLSFQFVPIDDLNNYIKSLVTDGFVRNNDEFNKTFNGKQYYVKIDYNNNIKKMLIHQIIRFVK